MLNRIITSTPSLMDALLRLKWSFDLVPVKQIAPRTFSSLLCVAPTSKVRLTSVPDFLADGQSKQGKQAVLIGRKWTRPDVLPDCACHRSHFSVVTGRPAWSQIGVWL